MATDDLIVKRILRIHEQRSRRKRLTFPPATEAQIRRAERSMRLTLPPLLKRLYLEVANGGFGPHQGLLGVEGGFADEDLGGTLVDAYRNTPKKPTQCPLCEMDDIQHWQTWPDCVVPVVNWGCARFSCVDFEKPSAPVLYWDAEAQPHPGPVTLEREEKSLSAWLKSWLKDPARFEKAH